jgi:ABC-type glycerol-3-phosphate transport system permease component
MDALIIKRKKFLPFLKSRENKLIFKLINIYLIIGGASLVITIIYLLNHLNISDRVIYFCIPGFVLGISSGIIYFFEYQSINSDKELKKHT